MDPQTWIVLAIVVAAALYVVRRVRRTVASARGDGCGGDCDCSPH